MGKNYGTKANCNSSLIKALSTLASEIYIDPTFIKFWCFSRPYGLNREYIKSKGHLDVFLLHKTCIFKALRLFFLPNFPGPMFIPCPTSILEARVVFRSNNLIFWLKDYIYKVISTIMTSHIICSMEFTFFGLFVCIKPNWGRKFWLFFRLFFEVFFWQSQVLIRTILILLS